MLFAFEASGITTGVIYYDIDGLFNELPLGLSRKKGRLRRCAGRPRSLNLVQSRYPLASPFCGGQGTGCGFSACRQGGLFDEDDDLGLVERTNRPEIRAQQRSRLSAALCVFRVP